MAQEASEASTRWSRDRAALGPYGHGASGLEELEKLRTAHQALRTTRPELVAAKSVAVGGRDADVAAGWAWVDMVDSGLAVLARSDAALATALNAALPTNDAGLDAGIGALAALVDKHKTALPADMGAQARIDEAPALRAKLAAAPGAVAVAKAAPVADTAALDLLDGKLYVTICDLNVAARRAIRNGRLAAKADDYRLHHLNRSGRPAPVVKPAEPPAP
ncbi:MAG: hypothetical protein HY908_05400 [Myxococcales bacterium]|nr:hypothetical protein [Myxococcales bacterium]